MLEFLATVIVIAIVAGLILSAVGGVVEHYTERWFGPGEQARWTAELARREQRRLDVIAGNEAATIAQRARYDATIRRVYRA